MTMPGATLAVTVIPIIVALSLLIWIALVTRADRRSGTRPGPDRGDPRTDLAHRARGGRDDTDG
jgi:hypothetical protein